MEIDKIYLGNNIEVLRTFPDNSVDSVVTDPPYGISFMNKHWDYDVPTVELWKEVYRILKPGGHMLVACGTRTQHRMAVNIEDAGFEIRDIVAWIYGSGFPKSFNIANAIEGKLTHGSENKKDFKKLDGVKGISSHAFVKRNAEDGFRPNDYNGQETTLQAELTTEEAKQYAGFGTALKPAMELWTLARKPTEGTIAENVLMWGTGGLNIDGCRIPTEDFKDKTFTAPKEDNSISQNSYGISGGMNREKPVERIEYEQNNARFPANVIHDGSDEVVKLFPNTDAGGSITKDYIDNSPLYGDYKVNPPFESYNDSGSAARFFYVPKASSEERNMGLYGFEEKETGELQGGRKDGSAGSIMPSDGRINPYAGAGAKKRNIHPTVKPVDLMKYLCRLITPKGGLVLDPYVGSGTTAIAAKQEKFHYIGIELEEEYVKIAEARIKAAIVEYNIFDFI